MQVRLLAYGGTCFAERARIGGWPPIPTDTLQDTYGLRVDALSYGVGVLREEPFLIVRERQNVGHRGGYPYTLLLDPGEPVWEQFGWNAAQLLLAILRTPLSSRLLAEPESFTAATLESALGSLAADPGARAVPPGPEDLRALCVGSATLPRFARGRPSIIVTPGALGLAGRPGPAEMAAALAGLPPCFRPAQGWLVGGGAAHGPALGARLILDDQGGPNAGLAGEDLAECRQQWSWWRELTARPESSGLVWTGEPVWRWPARYGVSATEVTATVSVLGELEAEEVSQLLGESRESPATLIELSRAWRSEQEAVRAEVNRRGVEAPPDLVRAARSIRRTAAEDLPRLVQGELGRWKASFSGQQVEVLVELALDQAAQQGTGLGEWAGLREDAVVGERVRGWLRQCASVLLYYATPEAVADYLAFGEDPGGARYAGTGPPAGQPESIVRLVVDACWGPAAAEAVAWLEKLAASPLRGELSVELKRAVAGRAPEAWASFRYLEALWSGEVVDTPPPRPSWERGHLFGELRGLIAEQGVEPVRGRLPELNAWLGALPEDLRRSLEPARPVTVRTEAAAVVSPPAASSVLLPEAAGGANKSALEDKLRDCLFGTYGQFDGARRQELVQILQAGDPELSTLLGKVVAECGETLGHNFARCCLSQPDLLQSLFEHLSERSRQRLVGCLARAPLFVGQAAQLLQRALDKKMPGGPFMQAVAEYLLSEKGAGLRHALAAQLGKPLEWIRQQLERLRR